MPRPNPASPCSRRGCVEPGHVVLFAAGGEFDGRIYRKNQSILFCLRHGGQVYDAIHHPDLRDWAGWSAQIEWLAEAMRSGTLPRVWADYHIPAPDRGKPWRTPRIPERTARRAGR